MANTANNSTYTLILNQERAKEFIMPAGYWPDVEIHCWGAGGGSGWGGSTGGGGGYAKVVVDINPGDRVQLQIGQPGTSASSPEIGGDGGSDNSRTAYDGGDGGGRRAIQNKVINYYGYNFLGINVLGANQVGLNGNFVNGNYFGLGGFGFYPNSVVVSGGGSFPSGGGGGASWVAVNDKAVCVGAGGGGGGGAGSTTTAATYYNGYVGYNGFGQVINNGVAYNVSNTNGYGYAGYGNGLSLYNFIPYRIPTVTSAPVKHNGNPGGVYPGQASTVYAVTHGAWSSFLNTYGVWGGGQDYTVSIDFPVTGTYTFRYSVDNYGSISLDGTPVISLAGTVTSHFTTFTTQTVAVTAGVHTVRVTGVNTGGPAGVGAQILKPDTSELWNTRALLQTSGLTATSRGESTTLGGGGGGGYLGGKAGIASGASVTGGNGGLNLGSTTAPGSGVFPGGRSGYYPGNRVGEAGYAGYIILVLRKKLNAFIKNPDASGEWVGIDSSFVKVPTQSVYVSRVPPPQALNFTTAGSATWTVPAGVTSATFMAAGGAGGAGGGDVGGDKNNTGGGGGGGSNFIKVVRAVNPGEVYTFNVGRGGAGAGGGGTGGTGGTTTVALGSTVLLSALGGTGGTRGGNSGNGSPGTGRNGAANGSGLNGGKSNNGGPTGGTGVARYNSTGGTGGGGSVRVLYQSIPEQVLVVTGGWKQIQQTFMKVDGEWRPVLNDVGITLNNY